MGLLKGLMPTAGVLPTVAVWGAFALRRSSARGDAPAGAQQRRIRVKEGYDPPEIHVAAGRPVRLVFRREETAPCSERVVFPDLGISVDLPAFQDIAVDLPASEPGAHRFCCQMNTLAGTAGSLLFGAIGLLAAIPFLLGVHRRCGNWRVPGALLALFSVMFSISTFVIGPAISGESSGSAKPTPNGPPPVRTTR